MSIHKIRNAWITFRVPIELRKEFHNKAEKYGRPSDVLREIVEAFVEDRLTIQPPVIRKFEGLFNHE